MSETIARTTGGRKLNTGMDCRISSTATIHASIRGL